MQKRSLSFEQMYIPIAVVLIVVLGTVFVWKLRSRGVEQQAAVVTARSSPSPSAQSNYIPATSYLFIPTPSPASTTATSSSSALVAESLLKPYSGDATPLAASVQKEIDQQSALIGLLPYGEEGRFQINFDKNSSLFIVTIFKPFPGNTTFFKQWLSENNFGQIPQKNFSYVYAE